jgi:hypothetical protein
MSMTTATSIRLAVAIAVAAAALAPRPARAQSAEAEALFQEGKRLMAKGDTAQACEKFEASDRVEAASGNELNLALCRETNGQLATAWAVYLKTAATAKREGNTRREVEARTKAAALKPRLVYLTIAVPDDSRVDGLAIKRNGIAVDEALWNQRVPVDPDEYTISGEAPGCKPWSTTVVVKTKSKKVEVPTLEKQPEPKHTKSRREARSTAAEDGEPSGARDRDADVEVRPAPSRWTGKRKLSLVLTAVGIAAAGAGIGFGVHANHLESQSDTLCDQRTCHQQDAVTLNQSARHYALAADIGFAAGGTAVVGAAVLWFFGAPRAPGISRSDDTAVIPTFGAGRVGFALARSF